ncbi:MAG: class I SAM-dependent methyltransferase [Planctomycetota bacterium]|jgi:SAM-dependent methyltransferase
MAVGKVMDERYWDGVAGDYDGEIFSVIANDRNEVITSKIRKYGDKGKEACDFGCGVGKFVPVLAENFDHVWAVDLSEELLEQAREECVGFENVTYLKKDLSRAKVKVAEVDFGLSVNVAIMKEGKVRRGIFRTMKRCVRKGGRLVVVVPSLESALYADYRLVQWNLRAGWNMAEAVKEVAEAERGGAGGVRQGLVEIEGVATKHYLEEELSAMFGELGFEVEEVEKVEYCWGTEFAEPPAWMGEPYPWDWLVVLRKI